MACSLTRIRNQRSAGGGGCETLETDDRSHLFTIHHCFAACTWLRLIVLVLVRTCPSLPAHHASHSTLRKLATDRHEASTFPVGRSVAPVERSASARPCVWPSLGPFSPSRGKLQRPCSPRFPSQCNIYTLATDPDPAVGCFQRSPVATRNFTSRSRHLLPKSRHPARPAGPSLMRSARPNTQSPPPSATPCPRYSSSTSTLPRRWEEKTRPLRPA